MNRDEYYRMARKGSLDSIHHPAFKILRALITPTAKVLDVGCGEGTRLDLLFSGRGGGVGIDTDAYAIKLAARQYPRHKFIRNTGRKLPFADNSFDVCYSAFVVEHVRWPEELLTEMIRVVKSGGKLVVWAPNYGAPNRRSLNSMENPISKFLAGLVRDLRPASVLNWAPVVPKSAYRQIDDDTVTEPYLGSLLRWLKQEGMDIEFASSWWKIEPWSINPRKLGLKLLGLVNVWPVKWWGPQLFVIASKS